ncbi:O-methyltransferase ZRP4 [Citrus sinensis]|uniref:O-methyltransferase n=1 Tax=Citrus reticulata TaxID=85571 RepID=A0A5K7YFK4_CITRE|nr:probable O-methyltransferase 3 [Citrus sinensis]KAH9742749.1 O-methyltransferase ZRP4 [Citrus sinensis]BBO60590.1 O-methyltransferase [Citrus reticulata]
MNLIDGEHDTELLEAQAHVWNHIFNFINSMSLKCAVELGIPDIINKHGKPMTLNELVSALTINPSKTRCVYRLMRILIHSGFFAQQTLNSSLNNNDEEQGYVLTNASKLLLKDNPLSVTPFLQAMLDPILLSPWLKLSTWFQNDDPTPFDTAHGKSFWEYAGDEPKINNFFNEAMASDARLATSVVIHKCKDVFEGLNSLVDVGGGTGTVAKAIAKAFPNLECTDFDLPHVVNGLESDLANLKYVGGDMFEAIPPADAVLFKWILHDWNDEECVKILKKCKEAITSDVKKGKVIIIDMMRENKKRDSESIETQLFFDMLMMVLVTGTERDEKEWAKLFADAGFNDYKITPILGLRSLIEVYP